jgi:aspartate racemase
VLKLEEEAHVMFFTIHHIICDAWSMEVLVREVGALYDAISEGHVSPLPELKIQYADYANWQRLYLRDETLEEHLQYWKKQLSGRLPVLDLAGDNPYLPVPGYRGAAKSILLPAELCKSLRTLSKREGVTLFMVLLAAFKTLLYKYTAEEDIIVGTAALNRNRTEIEPLIGLFVNMLPLRTDLSGNPRFSELLGRVREVALGAYAHQEMPFEKLVEAIQPEREWGQMPLFNIAFGVQNEPIEKARLNRIEIRPMAGWQDSARIDLSLWITESAEALSARWTYRAGLFVEEAIIRMHEHFETLLSGIVARPDAPLDKIMMLSESERAQQAIDCATRKENDYRRFKNVKPKSVALSED